MPHRYVTISSYGRVHRHGWLTVSGAATVCLIIYMIVPLLFVPSMFFQTVSSTQMRH